MDEHERGPIPPGRKNHLNIELPELAKGAILDPADVKLRRFNFLWMNMNAGPVLAGRKYSLNIELPDLAKAAIFDPANVKLRA